MYKFKIKIFTIFQIFLLLFVVRYGKYADNTEPMDFFKFKSFIATSTIFQAVSISKFRQDGNDY